MLQKVNLVSRLLHWALDKWMGPLPSPKYAPLVGIPLAAVRVKRIVYLYMPLHVVWTYGCCIPVVCTLWWHHCCPSHHHTLCPTNHPDRLPLDHSLLEDLHSIVWFLHRCIGVKFCLLALIIIMCLSSRQSILLTKAINSCSNFMGLITKSGINSWTVEKKFLCSLAVPKYSQNLSVSLTKSDSISFWNSFCIIIIDHVIDNYYYGICCMILTLISAYGLNFQKNQVACRLHLLLHQTIHRCRLSSTVHCGIPPHVLQTGSVLQPGVWHSYYMLTRKKKKGFYLKCTRICIVW